MQINHPRGIFQNIEKKNELIPHFEDKKKEKHSFKYMENILLESYKSLKNQISNKYDRIAEFRLSNSELANKLKVLNE